MSDLEQFSKIRSHIMVLHELKTHAYFITEPVYFVPLVRVQLFQNCTSIIAMRNSKVQMIWKVCNTQSHLSAIDNSQLSNQ